jgi:hypothetical protein
VCFRGWISLLSCFMRHPGIVQVDLLSFLEIFVWVFLFNLCKKKMVISDLWSHAVRGYYHSRDCVRAAVEVQFVVLNQRDDIRIYLVNRRNPSCIGRTVHMVQWVTFSFRIHESWPSQ